MKAVRGHLSKRLIGVLFVLLPIFLTWWILRFIFEKVDGILQPYVAAFVGHDIPGIGLVVTVAILYLLGSLAAYSLGSKVIGLIEALLTRIPVVKTIYLVAKQLVDSLDNRDPGKSGFNKVVMVHSVALGGYVVGFELKRVMVEKDELVVERVVVYVPTAPTPNSGYVLLYEPELVQEIDLDVSDVIGMNLSLGLTTPERIKIINSQSEAKEDVFTGEAPLAT